jgi:hypothetical protein
MNTARRSLPLVGSIAVVLAALLTACSAGGARTPSPSPGSSGGPGGTIIPGPSGGAKLNAGEIRLLLIDRFGPRWYCDPDEYPVARGSEQERATERFAEMKAEGELYGAVAKRLGIDPNAALTDAQKLAIYHVWKVGLSVPLNPVGDGRYRFDYTAQPPAGATDGTRSAGIVTDRGEITVEETAKAGEPNCPICLARGTLIDTPDGQIAVERLRLGDPIWTLDANGRRARGTVIALGSTTAPADHHVIRLELADGRSVTASPGHPLADGRRLGTLALGDLVDGSAIVGLAALPYSGGQTFDLVASGATGLYLSNGIPLASTLVSSR